MDFMCSFTIVAPKINSITRASSSSAKAENEHTTKEDGQQCHPRYRRTRIVTAQEVTVGGKVNVCFSCTCCTFSHYLVMCRHVYAVTKREPTSMDVFPECRKDYEVQYLTFGFENYTNWVDERTSILEFNAGMVNARNSNVTNPSSGDLTVRLAYPSG